MNAKACDRLNYSIFPVKLPNVSKMHKLVRSAILRRRRAESSARNKTQEQGELSDAVLFPA